MQQFGYEGVSSEAKELAVAECKSSNQAPKIGLMIMVAGVIHAVHIILPIALGPEALAL